MRLLFPVSLGALSAADAVEEAVTLAVVALAQHLALDDNRPQEKLGTGTAIPTDSDERRRRWRHGPPRVVRAAFDAGGFHDRNSSTSASTVPPQSYDSTTAPRESR